MQTIRDYWVRFLQAFTAKKPWLVHNFGKTQDSWKTWNWIKKMRLFHPLSVHSSNSSPSHAFISSPFCALLPPVRSVSSLPQPSSSSSSNLHFLVSLGWISLLESPPPLFLFFQIVRRESESHLLIEFSCRFLFSLFSVRRWWRACW